MYGNVLWHLVQPVTALGHWQGGVEGDVIDVVVMRWDQGSGPRQDRQGWEGPEGLG